MRGKKFLALVLALFMVLGVCPLTAFASESETQTQDESATNTHVEPTLSSDSVVFVSNEGSDDNDGDTTDTPVATLKHAVEYLGEDGGTIVVIGEVNVGNECEATYEYKDAEGNVQTAVDGRFVMPAHKGLVYITSMYDEVEYEGSIVFGTWNDNGSTKSNHFILGGPTTFENIHFATETNPVFYGRGHFVTMGEGITSDHSLLVVGYDQYTLRSTPAERATDVDTHIILKSGEYHTVAGMTRQSIDGTYLGDAYITVEAGVSKISTLAGLAAGANGGYFGNAYVEINGSTYGVIAGAAYSCTGGTYGDVTMIVNNATNASNTSRLDGMAHSGSHNAFGDVELTVNGGTHNSVEGYCYGTLNSSFGNSNLTIEGGSFSYINGVLMNDADKSASNTVVGSATTTFNGGSVTNYICGGSFRTGFTARDITLNLNNDITYAKTVTGVNLTGEVTINNEVTVNVSKGTFNGYLCALSYGYKSNESSKPTTNISGKPNVYLNVTGGTFTKQTAGSVMLVMNTTAEMTLGRVYYNISGGNIIKLYVGSRQGNIAQTSGLYFTYSGGTIGTISTAWATNYQKYYFIGEKTYETTKFETGSKNGWPGPGDNAFNYVNLATYPDAVYVRPEADGGDYVNDGLTPDTPVQSIYDAAATLGPNGGTIYMMGDVVGCQTPKIDGTLTFSAVLPGETEPNGYGFNLNTANLYLNSNVVFDGVTFKATGNEKLIAFQGHDVTINEKCATSLSDGGSVGLIAGYSEANTSHYKGGMTASQVSVYRDQTVTINGGEWINFYGGNRRFGQSASIGTYYGDLTINIGAGATFTNDTPTDDTYPNNAVHLIGSNIVKGNVTANLAGTFNTSVFGVGKLGIYYNGVNQEIGDKTYYYLITDGIGMRDDTKYEGNVTINATGTFTGKLDAICRPGDTPLYGDFTLDTTGGTFADGFVTDAKGVMGTKTYVGDAGVEALNYDTVNGAENKNSDPIRVITVGDSITWGSAATASEVDGYSYHLYNNNYPAQLQKILGEGAVVGNFGYPGARARHGVFNDYFGSSSYGLSMQFGEADAVIIALGTNESASVAAGGNPEYYRQAMIGLIEGYHAAYPDAIIYITTALPRFGTQAYTDAVEQVVMPIQMELAQAYEYTKLMDLYTDMLPYAEIDKANDPDIYFADKLHPTNLGYQLMAGAVADHLKDDLHYYAYEQKAVSCTEIGCDHYACIWCDAAYSENIVEPLGHDMVEVGRVDATTEADGYIDYECSRCGATTQEILPIIGKTYTEFEVIAPTCTEQGYTRHYCDQDDSYYDDNFVAALGHDHIVVTVDPDCTNEGSITTTCSRCDYNVVETIDALGHTAGEEATCTKAQICTVCGTTLVEALGHDTTVSVVAPTAHTAGYTHTVCSRGDIDTKDQWVDATSGLVLFVDTTAKVNGDGTVDAPFSLYSNALNYADTSFERTIVLMSMVNLNATYTERAHAATYTVTSEYDGVEYDGGFNVNGAFHYVQGGNTAFENLTFSLKSTFVFRAKCHDLTLGEGVVTTGGNVYIVGADQASNSDCDVTRDYTITILSGKYYEVIGAYRTSSLKGNKDITGTINFHVGGTAEIDKLFIGNRQFSGNYITNANVTIDGGIINYFITASDAASDAAIEAAAPRGTITVNVTKNFDVSKSFTVDAGISYNGFAIAGAIKEWTLKVRDSGYGKAILNVDALVYNEIAEAGMIIDDAINELNIIGELVEGDFDGDGALTNADVTLLVRYLSGWNVEGTPSDVNGDEKINNRDAIYLAQKIAGWFDEQ